MVKLTDKMFKYKRLEIEINKMRGGETEKIQVVIGALGLVKKGLDNS